MIRFNIRWVCGRLRQARKLWVVVSLAAILVLFRKNLRSDDAREDDAKNFSVDGKNDDLMTFFDLQKAFDSTERNSAVPSPSFADNWRALDKKRPNKPRGKNLLYSANTKSVDSKTNDSILIPIDLQKAFNNKKNDSRIRSVDLQTASGTKKIPLKVRRLSDEELPKVFARKMTGQEKAIVFEILQALDTVSAKLQLRYFLCGGTLLGSFRHHDLIPWDDDVDVYMNLTERDTIYSGLSSLSPAFEVFSAGARIKLYSQRSRVSSRYPWNYPYVDINFFFENATHIIDSDPIFESMAYRKETIFPLHRRPLGGLFPFGPFDTYSYLTNTYTNITLCSTTHYDHRTEKLLGDGAILIAQCRRLRDLFPFVYRTIDPDSNGLRETLKIGDTELHTLVVREPQYAVGDPFSLVRKNKTRVNYSRLR